MATTDNPKIVYSAPVRRFRHNVADQSAAKDYFMHRRTRDSTHAPSRNAYTRTDPNFILMPLKAHSETRCPNTEDVLAHLPAELILDIFELLPPVDALSFRTASKHIYALSLNKAIQSSFRGLQGESAHEYAWRRRKDCFNRLAEYEVANDDSTRYTPREKLLCSYCLDFHLISAFGPLERECAAITAHERQCIASAATVYFCPHTQMAFEDFIRLSDADFSWSVCTQTCNPRIRYCPTSCNFHLTQEIPLYMEDIHSYRQTQQHPALIRCKSCNVACFPGCVAAADIVEAIKDMDVYVCPHAQGKEKEKISHLLEDIVEARGWYSGCEHTNDDPNANLTTGGQASWYCWESDCGAALCVVLDGIKSRINIYRKLEMTTVMSENWLANVEYPGQEARLE